MRYYLNGRLVDAEEALVPVTDHGFLYGDACFESVGVWGGRLIHLDDHVDRFFRSARVLRLAPPLDRRALGSLLREVAAANGFEDVDAGWLRVQLTRGTGGLGVGHSADLHDPTFVVVADAGAMVDPRRSPISVRRAVVSTYFRAHPALRDPRIKSIEYLTSVLAFLEARERGADVAILRTADGYVAEAHVANLFCVRDGELWTPPRTVALEGVTRRHVLEAARSLGIVCREEQLTAYDLYCADEVFTTAAASAVTAVGTVDGIALSHAVPGPVTSAVRATYVEQAYAAGTPIRQA